MPDGICSPTSIVWVYLEYPPSGLDYLHSEMVREHPAQMHELPHFDAKKQHFSTQLLSGFLLMLLCVHGVTCTAVSLFVSFIKDSVHIH